MCFATASLRRNNYIVCRKNMWYTGCLDQRGPGEPSALQGGSEAVGDAERLPGRAVLREEAVGARAGVVGLGGRDRARPRGGREEAPRPSRREEEEAAGGVGGAGEGREPREPERERRVAEVAQRHRVVGDLRSSEIGRAHV